MNGSAVVIGVDDTSVTVQLMSGNAEFNILTNDDIYIDQLDLGEVSYPPFPQGSDINFPFEDKVKIYGPVDTCTSVWLPVLYNDEDLYNDIVFDFGTNKFCTTGQENQVLRATLFVDCYSEAYRVLLAIRKGELFESVLMRNLYIVSAVQTRKISGHYLIDRIAVFDELKSSVASSQ